MPDDGSYDWSKLGKGSDLGSNPAGVGAIVSSVASDITKAVPTPPSSAKPAAAPAATPSAYPIAGDAYQKELDKREAALASVKKADEEVDKKEAKEDFETLSDYRKRIMAEGETHKKKLEGEIQEFKERKFTPPPPTDPWQLWGSPAMMLAGLSGFVGRRSAQKSIAAAAAVVSATNAKDERAKEQAFQAWKAENENYIRAIQWEHDSYEDAIKLMKTDSETGLAMAHAQAIMHKNPAAIEMSQRSVDDFKDFVKSARQLQDRLIEQSHSNALQMDLWRYEHPLEMEVADKEKEYLAAQAAFNASPTDENKKRVDLAKANHEAVIKMKEDEAAAAHAGMGRKGSGTLELTPGARMDRAIRFIMTGRYPPYMYNPDERTQLENDVDAFAQRMGIPKGQLAMMFKMKTADASALMKDVVIYDGIAKGQEVLEKTLPLAQHYMDQLRLTDYPTMNQAIVWAETQTGNPSATAFSNAMTDIALEWGRLEAGANSLAMLPVEMVKLGQERIANLTPAQFVEEARLLRARAQNTLEAQGDQIVKRKQSLISLDYGTGAYAEGASTPSPEAEQYLRAHPEARADFEAKYGKEAADRILGK